MYEKSATYMGFGEQIKLYWRAFRDAFIALTTGETLMLIATLCFGLVGAYGTYLFYSPSRGFIIGVAAAVGIESLYIGAAGMAITKPQLKWFVYALVAIGSLGSAYFGIMASLREALPDAFAPAAAHGSIRWPSSDEWVVFGSPAIVEGVIPALATTILSLLLHGSVTSRQEQVESHAAQIEVRRHMKPYECPFCSYSDDSAPKLWGHFGRCPDVQSDPRSDDDKKALVRVAVAEGKRRILEG